MSIELLTEDAGKYVESREAKLSDYDMRGIHTHISGCVAVDRLELQIYNALINFRNVQPKGTETVVKFIRDISLSSAVSFDPETGGHTFGVIYSITMDGTALIPKKKPGDGKELRTVATNLPKSIDDDLGAVFGGELSKRDLVGVVK